MITETFPAPETKAASLFWLPAYVNLSRSVFDNYTRTGETSERARHVSNCAARWGVTRRVAEAILTGEAEYTITDSHIIVTRPVTEEPAYA